MEYLSSKFLKNADHPTLTILSAPFNGGQPCIGAELGPTWLLKPECITKLETLNWNIQVHSDLNLDKLHLNNGISMKKAKNCQLVGETTYLVYEALLSQAQKGNAVLSLGGDHSLAIGTISATSVKYGPDLGVIWVDAHADINTPEVTLSGNMHGMPVAFLLGLPGTDNIPGFEWLYAYRSSIQMNSRYTEILPYAHIRPERLVYIGLRDLDAAEKIILKRYNILAFSMHDIDKYGIVAIMEKAMNYLGPNNPIHLSFDVDGMDPSVSPSTGTPVIGGLSFRESRYLCEIIARSGQLIAMDLMEVNPVLGHLGAHNYEAVNNNESGNSNLYYEAIYTVQAARSIIYAAFGRTLL